MSWSRYLFSLFCLIWVATVADCAINLDGTQAVDPAGACKYGFCPSAVCMRKPSSTADDDDEIPEGIVTVPPDYEEDSVKTRDENDKMCYIYRVPDERQDGLESCKKQCQPTLDEAAEAGRIFNYGCVSFRPLDSPITWQKSPASGLEVIGGQCSCDNWLLNDLVETFIEALPAIFQSICYIFVSTIKLVVDVGTSFFLTGGALTAGADMLLTAAEMTNWVYSQSEDPAGAFGWWLSPCGGTNLVPDEIKQVFDILSVVPSGRSSFRGLKNIKKGSGKKGDEGNPTDRSAPRPIGGKKNPPAGGNNPNPSQSQSQNAVFPRLHKQNNLAHCTVPSGFWSMIQMTRR